MKNKKESKIYQVGKINKRIYRCITTDIITKQVIITENQLEHVLERHPSTYIKTIRLLRSAVECPDFIIEDKHKHTGLVIKKIEKEDRYIQIVLRIKTSEDRKTYKNSIISWWEINDRRLKNYLRNKNILYKKEEVG